MDHITDMGYSLNRVSPIFEEQTDPCADPQTLEIPHQHPGHNVGHINKNFCSTGC